MQTRVETPQIIFRYQTDSTTNLNEALDASETTIDVVDNSVFSDDDVILIDDELMLITDADVGANQILVTRDYGTTIADTHADTTDIYIMTIYPVMNISDLSFDPFLGTPEAVVTVSNADQSWNIFLSDLTNHTRLAIIELQFTGLDEYMPIFTGIVDHVEYSDINMTCSIYLNHKLAKFLNQEIDPDTDALDMVNGPDTNPMDFIWAILVDEGGLDSEESQDNIDIDHTMLDITRTKLTAQNISIGARIPRAHTYRTAIQLILDLCSCWGFVTNEGKIGFDYAANDAVAGDHTWTQAHILSSVDGGDVDGNRPFTDASEIVNWQNMAYGYVPHGIPDDTLGLWTGTTINQDGTSQGVYGLAAIAEAGTLVWHNNAASATGGSDWVEDIHKNPMVFSEIKTWLYGARVQIGDVIDFTDADYGWTNELLKIMNVSWDLTNFVITVLVRA